MNLPRLYAIIDRGTLDARGISVAAFARDLCAAGVRLVQYRDKVSAPQDILLGAHAVAEVFANVETTLLLNDRADLAALLEWGVHVGQGDLSPQAARSLVGSGIIGVSTHHQGQVLCATHNEFSAADYIATGPVFATSTKSDAEPVVGLEGVRQARALTDKPLVAIGGITRENARSVLDAGADSVAVISGFFVAGMSVGTVVQDFLERMR